MPMSDYMRTVRERVGTMLLEVPAVSVLARDEQDRVVLVKNAEVGRWVTPGGAVEPLELPAEAAVREMWEESGLHVELVRLVGVFGGPEFVVQYANGDRTSYAMIVFEGRIVGGTPRPDGVETSEVRFFTREEIEQGSWEPWMPEVLRALYADPPGLGFRAPAWRPPAATQGATEDPSGR